jgi:hypothetical protein
VERDSSCGSVITDLRHQGSNEIAIASIKGQPVRFHNVEPLAGLWRAESRSKLLDDRLFDQARWD